MEHLAAPILVGIAVAILMYHWKEKRIAAPRNSNSTTTIVNSVQQADGPIFEEGSKEGRLILIAIARGKKLLLEARDCKDVPEDRIQVLAERCNEWYSETYTTLAGFSLAAALRFDSRADPSLVQREGCTNSANAIYANMDANIRNLTLLLK